MSVGFQPQEYVYLFAPDHPTAAISTASSEAGFSRVNDASSSSGGVLPRLWQLDCGLLLCATLVGLAWGALKIA